MQRFATASVLLLLLGCADDGPLQPTLPSAPALASALSVFTSGYSITDLGTPGEISSYGSEANDRGEVGGFRRPNGSYNRGVIWDLCGNLRQLPDLGGTTHVLGLNRSGVAAGMSIGNGAHAVRWRGKGAVLNDLDPGNHGSVAWDVNGSGTAVGGKVDPATGSFRATAWLPSFVFINPAPVDLGAPQGSDSEAYGVSDRGAVVGYYTSPGGQTLPFVWTPAAGFKTLPVAPGTTEARAHAVNELGMIVGFVTSPTVTEAAIWRTSTSMPISLGTLGGAWSKAYGVNRRGWVVGVSEIGAGNQEHAFIWTPTWGMEDLGTLPGSQGPAIAEGISDNGFVAGISFDAAGKQRAVRWAVDDAAHRRCN